MISSFPTLVGRVGRYPGNPLFVTFPPALPVRGEAVGRETNGREVKTGKLQILKFKLTRQTNSCYVSNRAELLGTDPRTEFLY